MKLSVVDYLIRVDIDFFDSKRKTPNEFYFIGRFYTSIHSVLQMVSKI